MATVTHQILLTAEQFLAIDFGPDMKAELDNGVIRMMTGGNRAHARVQRNLMRYLGNVLRGSGCAPFGPDMAVRTGDYAVRFPDVSVVCGDPDTPDKDRTRTIAPCVVVEVLSDSTSRSDQTAKLEEYRGLACIDTIVFVDPLVERLRIVQRTGPSGWSDVGYHDAVDLPLPALSLTIPHAEIFARD